jgi:hypothetical protein
VRLGPLAAWKLGRNFAPTVDFSVNTLEKGQQRSPEEPGDNAIFRQGIFAFAASKQPPFHEIYDRRAIAIPPVALGLEKALVPPPRKADKSAF